MIPRCMHFQKLNTYYLVPVYNYYRTLVQDIINEVFQTLDQSYSSLFELELSTIMDQKGAIWLMYVNTIPPYEHYIRHSDSLAEKYITDH